MISNILEQEDIIKGLPDAALQKEARAPSGALQQFLVVSEIKRRTDMRKSHENQMKEQPQGTVADQIVMEGIAGMMPQQGVGMPPQMGPQMPPQGMPPQGGPQMPPQMPPMGMASGGIVRMANGGSTGMPGAYALAGLQAEYIDPLVARAKVLAKTTGRSIEEAYDALLREAQMNMPNYQMVGRTGTGEISDMIAGARSAMGDTYDSVIREAQMNMPNYSMIAPAGMGELPSIDMPSGTRPPKAITGGIDLGALGDIDSAVGSGIQSLYDMVPKSSSVGIADRISALTDELGITGVDRDAKRRARIEKNLQQSAGLGQKPGTEPADPFASALELVQEVQTDASDPRRRRGRQPTVQGDSPSGIPQRSRGVEGEGIGGFFDGIFEFVEGQVSGSPSVAPGGVTSLFDAPTEQTPASGAEETIQEINARLGIGPSGPVSYPFGRKKAQETKNAQVQAQENDKAVQAVNTASSFDLTPENIAMIDGLQALTEGSITRDAKQTSAPDLDFADLIADSKRLAQANALMQLGAGIAAGDTAKALSAAGTAATKGMQEARTLDLRKRLTEYQAGREDLRRDEEKRRYEEGMDLKRDQFKSDTSYRSAKLLAELEASAGLDRRALLKATGDMIKEANDELLRLDQQGAEPEAILELQTYLNTLKKQYKKYADDISMSLATSGGQNPFSGFTLEGTRQN